MEVILCNKYGNRTECPGLEGVKKHINALLTAYFQIQKDKGTVTICAIMRIYLYNWQLANMRPNDALCLSGKDLT